MLSKLTLPCEELYVILKIPCQSQWLQFSSKVHQEEILFLTVKNKVSRSVVSRQSCLGSQSHGTERARNSWILPTGYIMYEVLGILNSAVRKENGLYCLNGFFSSNYHV